MFLHSYGYLFLCGILFSFLKMKYFNNKNNNKITRLGSLRKRTLPTSKINFCKNSDTKLNQEREIQLL